MRACLYKHGEQKWVCLVGIRGTHRNRGDLGGMVLPALKARPGHLFQLRNFWRLWAEWKQLETEARSPVQGGRDVEKGLRNTQDGSRDAPSHTE